MNQIRRETILDFIQKQELVTIKQLRDLCPDVSLMTVHRDLDVLAESGQIIKIRGGARSVRHSSEPAFAIRKRENTAGKQLIARKALPLIQPKSTLFIDAGTTGLAVAAALADIPLSIFTTGPNIAVELSRLVRAEVILCGGSLNKDNLAVSGHSTLEMLEHINIDLALVGVSGCGAENGFTCGRESEMLVKQLVIKKAQSSAILCDRSKLTRLMPFTFARIGEIDYLITDGSMPEAFYAEAKGTRTRIL